ncbi:hypothetical protein [Liquorilactobacillus mali]|uniref:Uncharacterized protein n=1 Tax=Liquorilactobacillus mali KCTC 3596 = DSM 20444 TaxID=1046596 RepID=A0A0R2DZI4_9LACO|nr:hypothetical protein [Liquorilactobacillus mali]KRN09346.1 hypothetical protein FD00_GL001068 [Liquorilactobacillus mali KCTC 3596 = DSM 20444]
MRRTRTVYVVYESESFEGISKIFGVCQDIESAEHLCHCGHGFREYEEVAYFE